MSLSIAEAARQTWPPFVLVAGLLAVGAVLESDGVFAAVGARVERLGGGAVALLAALLGLEAVVTALLNLDTAAVFMTPIALHASRRRDCDVRPFLYGTLFVANGASLLLPGSNLTNLIVLAHTHLNGAAMARTMALPWLAATAATIAYLAAVFRLRGGAGTSQALPPLRVGVGAVAAATATALILALHNPALPVLAVGLAATAVRRLRPRLDPQVLAALFLLAVALGTLARRWHEPASLVARAGGVGDALLGAGTSVVVNNLPAASLLAAQAPAHPLPLLVGLNLGPNLAWTGSLSAYLWYRAARSVGERPSARLSSLLALGLVPLTLAVALAALALVDPSAF